MSRRDRFRAGTAAWCVIVLTAAAVMILSGGAVALGVRVAEEAGAEAEAEDRIAGPQTEAAGAGIEESTTAASLESVPRELFKFQVPRDAEFIVADPALGRTCSRKAKRNRTRGSEESLRAGSRGRRGAAEES